MAAKSDTPATEVAVEAPQVAAAVSAPVEQVGRLASRLDRPITVDYAGEQLVLRPRGTTNIGIVRSKLGKLPAGVVFVQA